VNKIPATPAGISHCRQRVAYLGPSADGSPAFPLHHSRRRDSRQQIAVDALRKKDPLSRSGHAYPVSGQVPGLFPGGACYTKLCCPTPQEQSVEQLISLLYKITWVVYAKRTFAPAALTSVLSETQNESGKNLLFLSEKGRRNMAFCRRNPQRSGFFEITSCGFKSNLHILY
jgi:hypothetical protein